MTISRSPLSERRISWLTHHKENAWARTAAGLETPQETAPPAASQRTRQNPLIGNRPARGGHGKNTHWVPSGWLRFKAGNLRLVREDCG